MLYGARWNKLLLSGFCIVLYVLLAGRISVGYMVEVACGSVGGRTIRSVSDGDGDGMGDGWDGPCMVGLAVEGGGRR